MEEEIAELQARGREDLLPLSYAFAALVFTGSADKQRLRERFNAMHSILEGSWAYQEMVQKGLAEGIQQGIQQGQLDELREVLVHLVQIRFPALVALAKQQALLVEEKQALYNAIDAIINAQTVDEARNAIEMLLRNE